MPDVFHIELRQFPHTARSFNLSQEELSARLLTPWTGGESVKWSERSWSPDKAKLTIIRGPELPPDRLGMGRGWQEAVRKGEEVTAEMLAKVRPDGHSGELPRLKEALLDRCAHEAQPLSAAVELAGELLEGRRASEGLALAEQAVWEVLHEGRARLLDPAGATVSPESWQRCLLSWSSWSGSLSDAPRLAGGG